MILNRITVYASTRRPVHLTWEKRLALRIVPILLLGGQMLTLLRAIRCQTSPDFIDLTPGLTSDSPVYSYGDDGGIMYKLSSALLFWESDAQTCDASHPMISRAGEDDFVRGSFGMLWPVFFRLCISHFAETIACALSGRRVLTETGMSLFEHSLAFAEAETMLRHVTGLMPFGSSSEATEAATSNATVAANATAAAETAAAVSYITLDHYDVPAEVLLMCFLSCANSLTSAVLHVTGKQHKWRLLQTTFWGLCFMATFTWGVCCMFTDMKPDILRFPTVCIVGFIPHLLILIGVVVCASIYGFALLLCAFSLPPDLPQPQSLKERFQITHDNLMQGAFQLRGITLRLHEDFYTALLRVGFAALSAAHDAVFLNEGKGIVAKRMTWLEEERLTELACNRKGIRYVPPRNPNDGARLFDIGADGEIITPEAGKFPGDDWVSGFDQEKSADDLAEDVREADTQIGAGGVGVVRDTTRQIVVVAFVQAIFALQFRLYLLGVDRTLSRLGISWRPRWMLRRLGRDFKDKKIIPKPDPLDFWILSDEGELKLPDNDDFDVELEMRKREEHDLATGRWDESRFERKLYNWWKAGGSWGERDTSDDYVPPSDIDDDATSVITTTTAASEADTDNSGWESDSENDDGRRTPTQQRYNRRETSIFSDRGTRESTPAAPEVSLDATYLSRLLSARDPETKAEARILAAHLAAETRPGGIMTRSRFRQMQERERARILTSRGRSAAAKMDEWNTDGTKRPLTSEEESEILEHLILERREASSQSQFHSHSHTDTSNGASQNWSTGATGLGTEGPQCVVCQASPRTVIAWPCRCLCVCEDCRVSLAMNNFGNCVTCRRTVMGFVRLWVP